MKRKSLLKWMAAFVVAMLCVGLASCDEKDDDKEKTEKTGKIVGLVSDYANANTPIAGATVTLVQLGDSKVTGVDGRFEFDNLKPGSVVNIEFDVFGKYVQRLLDEYFANKTK